MISNYNDFKYITIENFSPVTETFLEKIKQNIEPVIHDFENNFRELTGENIKFNIKSIFEKPFSEAAKIICNNFSLNYTRELISGKDQIFITTSDSFIDNYLSKSNDKGRQTFIKKEIANHFVTDFIKKSLCNNGGGDFKETEIYPGFSQEDLINGCTNMENDWKFIVNKYPYSPNSVIICQVSSSVLPDCDDNGELEDWTQESAYFEEEIKEENEYGILIAGNIGSWKKIIGEKSSTPPLFSSHTYCKQNCWAVLGENDFSEDYIRNMRIGEKITFNDSSFSRVSVVINNREIAVGKAVVFDDYKYGIVIEKGDFCSSAEDKFFKSNKNNLFLILGHLILDEDKIERYTNMEIRENYYNNFSFMEESFNKLINEDLFLVYKNQIIAQCKVIQDFSIFTVKITKILEQPIVMIK